MALPAGVARWTLSGSLHGEETWAFDWWTQPGVGVASAAAWQTTCDDYAGILGTTGFNGALVALLCTSGDNIGALKGLYYRNAQTAEYTATHNFTGLNGTSNSFYPFQMSFCVTTLSDHPTRRTRGRAYLPARGATLDANSRFTSAQVGPVAAKLANVLHAGVVTGEIGPPVVVSRTGTLATPMTSIRYDLRPDVQRRRANKQGTGGQTTVILS